MITINYQTFGNKGFHLRLRLYQAGETRFINISKLLKGSINKKYWNQKKQLFTASCPYSEENNAILIQFRQRYEEMAINWNGSVAGMLAAMSRTPARPKEKETLSGFLKWVINDLKKRKHADGTIKGTYEVYEKLDRRLAEYCHARNIKYKDILLRDLDAAFVNDIFAWVEESKRNKGICYISKMLHSVLMRADKEDLVDFKKFKKCNWYQTLRFSTQKNNTLTEAQCKEFATLNLDDISDSPLNELYRDFCMFILYTGQSVCDAVSLKYSDIQVINGISHFVFRRRKIAEKQAVPCAVPINSELDRIMFRWRRLARDGYVFPIRNKEKLKNQTTNNGDIKHFIRNLNLWLKKVGKAIKCPFSLHSYTFRHTAITHYISKGVPIIYVANMMGTSVENCEKIYYNNQGDTASRNKVIAAMKF